jgi:choline-glycine betaine transporter
MVKGFFTRQVDFLETVAIALVLIVVLCIISKDSLTFVIAAYSLLLSYDYESAKKDCPVRGSVPPTFNESI